MSLYEKEISNFLIDKLQDKFARLGINKEDIDEEFSLIDSGLVDSMGFLDLLAAVEEHFSTELDFEDLDPSEFTTFLGFVRCAAKNIGNTNGKN